MSELDNVKAALKRSVVLVDRLALERDQARADVLKLRDGLKRNGIYSASIVGYAKMLADTEHYEQYR